MQRLREGKVYVPHTATRALDHYFSPGNLTALRELALRRTAQRVDAQLLDHMQAHAISGPWAAGERVLVCVTGAMRGHRPGPRWCAMAAGWPSGCARRGRRCTSRRRARCACRKPTATASPTRCAWPRRLGARGGDHPRPRRAPTTSWPMRASNNFSHIVVGKPGTARWFGLLRGNIATALIAARRRHSRARRRRRRRAGAPPAPPAPAAGAPRRPRPVRRSRPRCGGGGARLGTGVGRRLAVSSDLAGVPHRGAGGGRAFGLWPSLYACLISVLAYNFFFLPPIYTFTIADPENVVALFFFLMAAVIASNLAAGVRAQALTARDARAHHRGALPVQPQARRHRRRSTTCCGPPPTRSRRC